MSGRGRVRVQDLPTGVTLAMMITQAVFGILMGFVISRVIQRVFTTGYAILTTKGT